MFELWGDNTGITADVNIRKQQLIIISQSLNSHFFGAEDLD